MSKIPFLFCRYQASIDDTVLDVVGLNVALSEHQGQLFPHGQKAQREGRNDCLVMQPRRLSVNDEEVVAWAIGHRPGHRTVTDYDPNAQEIRQRIENDTNIIHTHMMAIPRLGVMAVNDRTNASSMGAKSALSRMRSAFKHMPGGFFDYWFLQPGDVSMVMRELDLKEYAFTVRRINPTPPGALAAALDATMSIEGVGIQRGIAKPMPGGEMHIGEGIIGQTAQMAEGGYAVIGFKGETSDGSLAQIRKPPFSLEKSENLRQMEKEQPLRVFIDDGSEKEIMAGVVTELVRFYDRDEAPTIPEQPD